MTINAILACDSRFGIGYRNKLPWPKTDSDMKWFRENTINDVVVMGRKTWDSLDGKKLSSRTNVVLTSDKGLKGPDKVLHNVKAIPKLEKQYPDQKIWIIGGAELYKQTIQYCQNIYLSRFYDTYECDTFIDQSLFSGFSQLSSPKKAETCEFSIWSRI